MEKLAKAETLFHLATLTLTDTKKGAERIAAKKEGLLLLQKTLEFYPKHIGAHYALGQLYKEGGVTPRSYHESFIHLQQASDEASLTVIEKDLTHLYYRFSSEEVEPFYQAENKGAYKILASMLNDDLLPAKDAGLLMSQMASVATKNIPSYKARKKSKKHLASYAKRKELDDYLTLKADDLARQKDSQQESYKDSIVKLLYTKAGVIDQNAEILTKDTLEEMVAIEADDGVSSERLSLLSGQAGRNSKGRKIAERSSKGLVTPVLW
jgi:hypothetical protein